MIIFSVQGSGCRIHLRAELCFSGFDISEYERMFSSVLLAHEHIFYFACQTHLLTGGWIIQLTFKRTQWFVEFCDALITLPSAYFVFRLAGYLLQKHFFMQRQDTSYLSFLRLIAIVVVMCCRNAFPVLLQILFFRFCLCFHCVVKNSV